LPVPAQDRGWCDQESAAAASGWQSSEGGDYGSVGPADPRSWCASLQDGQLMAQDEDLDLTGASERAWSTIRLGSFANIWRSASPPLVDHGAPSSVAKHQFGGSARGFCTRRIGLGALE
jgi:hypothetical protein